MGKGTYIGGHTVVRVYETKPPKTVKNTLDKLENFFIKLPKIKSKKSLDNTLDKLLKIIKNIEMTDDTDRILKKYMPTLRNIFDKHSDDKFITMGITSIREM